MTRPRRARAASSSALGALALAALTGCTVPVAVELDEADANRIVTLLDSTGIAAEKSADRGDDGKYRIEVAQDEAARAVAALTEEGLPLRKTPGLLDTLGASSLVPSPSAEHERLLAGIAGELVRTLEGVDGVLSARVHLAVPRPDPLATDAPQAPPSASVLIRYRGSTSPLPDDDVRRLVAFAVPGLSLERVAVIDALSPPLRAPRDVVRLGPLSTTRASARKVRAAIVAVLLVNLALVACLVALWARLRRLRRIASDAGLPKPREMR